ncbi:MAG: DUF3472 domain-containing protein [Clostridia bacterium]|nr:DUF3472 domain-containing protein [Clostridia bacterium]
MNVRDDRMAYNIYSDPDLSATSRAFKSFVIDFCATKRLIHTYWALCNFGLYFSEETKEAYPEIAGGGAYAGLQLRDDGTKAIMAFWEMTVGAEKKIMRANRVYPKGDESNFGGEGEGTNCIRTYEWVEGNWYRMALYAWEDEQTGNTFVGQWVCDLATGKWDLISYFNTHLYNSALRGGMSLFQENYIGGVNQYEKREFRVKNMYVLDRADDEWKSLHTTRLSAGNGGAANKGGAYAFGAAEDYFWGSGGGLVADQEAYDKGSVSRAVLSIKQPAVPALGYVQVDSLTVAEGVASWSYTAKSNPQLSFTLAEYDAEGALVAETTVTRPEVTSLALTEKTAKVALTVKDIFGNTVTVKA